MKESTRNFWVGVFVLASLTTLGVLMVWFGETPTFLQRGEWTLSIAGINEIRGIGDGTPVLMSGVEIGRVKRLEFENRERPGRGVLIVTHIKKRYSVPAGSVARIYGASLGIGRGQVNILVPKDERPMVEKDGGSLIFGEMVAPFGEVIPEGFVSSFQYTLEQFGEFSAAAKPVAEHFGKLLEPRPIETVEQTADPGQAVTANFSTAIERFDRVLADFHDLFGDELVQRDLKTVAADLRLAAGSLKEAVEQFKTETQRTADNLNDGIDHTDEKLQAVLTQLAQVTDRLDTSADHINQVTSQIAEGKGTIGLLVRDPRLYESAVLSFDRFSEAFATINRIAGKIEEDGYITLAQQTIVGPVKKDFPIRPKPPERE